MATTKVADKTKEFLDECKKAGYEKVAIFIRDKRIPLTTKIKSGNWFGDELFEDGPKSPIKVVCGHPEQINDKGFPKMWSIVKDCGLVAGLQFGGSGLGDAHDVHPDLCGLLTAGHYDLANI